MARSSSADIGRPCRAIGADLALRLGERDGEVEGGHGTGRVAGRVGRERPQREDVDARPDAPAGLGRLIQAIEEGLRRLEGARVRAQRMLREQHLRVGDVLELARIGQGLVGGDAMVDHPAAHGLGIAQRCVDARPAGVERAHVRGEVGDVHPLGIGEELEGDLQLTLGLGQHSGGSPPAIRELRQAHCLAKVLGARQMLACDVGLAAFETDLRQSDVHVGNPSQARRILGRQTQRVLVALPRIEEPALRDADVGQRDRAAEHVRLVARTHEVPDADLVLGMSVVEIATGPAGQSRQRRGRTADGLVVGRRLVLGLLSAIDRCREVARDEGERRPVQVHGSGDARQLGLVDDHHRVRIGPAGR